MPTRRTLAGLLLLPLAGCAGLRAPGSALPLLPAVPVGPYTLGPGDGLTIRVYDQPQLTGAYSVSDGGSVDLPLLGSVQAQGLSTGALAGAIASALQRSGMILHPSVAVEVSSYRPFYILGEVNTPGPYPYRPGMTALSAVSVAGGYTPRACTDYVGVTRAAAQYRAGPLAFVLPGDVVTVFERRF